MSIQDSFYEDCILHALFMSIMFLIRSIIHANRSHYQDFLVEQIEQMEQMDQMDQDAMRNQYYHPVSAAA